MAKCYAIFVYFEQIYELLGNYKKFMRGNSEKVQISLLLGRHKNAQNDLNQEQKRHSVAKLAMQRLMMPCFHAVPRTYAPANGS